MKIKRLIIKEIGYRKLNFALGVLSVAFAVGCFTAVFTLLRLFDARTAEIIAEKEKETDAFLARVEDDYRKITKKMGFNVQILPKDQNLADFYAEDYATKYMPESYVEKLANSRIMTIRHLLPILQQKIEWPEVKRKVLLVGTKAEVPLMHRAPKKPILDPVKPGAMVLGYELHHSLGLEKGKTVTFMGRKFKVAKCLPERGGKDDITVWINLKEAQELLGKQGKINGILALSCQCEGARLAQIRREITGILPDTQVVEFASKAIARAEARAKAAETRRRMVEAEKRHRERMRRQLETWAAIMIPVVAIGAFVWIAFLALANVRERRSEIGILRALGLGSAHIVGLFLGRAALVGFAGAVIGYSAGTAIGAAWGSISPAMSTKVSAVSVPLLVGAFAAAPLLSVLAAWLPALVAAQQDPAEILREE